jgi:cathepsin B
MLFLVALVVLASAAPRYIVDEGIINAVNSKQNLWVAGRNEKFVGVKVEDASRYLGVHAFPSLNSKFEGETRESGRNDLPEEYDVREAHPGCVIAVRDQQQCGSCWAFGASESLSDRFNIELGTCTPATQVILSPQDLVSCDKQQHGCNGGWPIKVWNYANKTGVTLDSCDPYTSGGGQTGTCKVSGPGAQCPSGKGVQKFYHSGAGYRILGEEAMMKDIYENGPIEIVFEVYQDFFNYKSGVYKHVSGGLAGYHAVKMFGWGVDQKTHAKYWILYNSWGTGWGNKGEFWVLRGVNECKIEKPDSDKPDLCNSAALPGSIQLL